MNRKPFTRYSTNSDPFATLPDRPANTKLASIRSRRIGLKWIFWGPVVWAHQYYYATDEELAAMHDNDPDPSLNSYAEIACVADRDLVPSQPASPKDFACAGRRAPERITENKTLWRFRFIPTI